MELMEQINERQKQIKQNQIEQKRKDNTLQEPDSKRVRDLDAVARENNIKKVNDTNMELELENVAQLRKIRRRRV